MVNPAVLSSPALIRLVEVVLVLGLAWVMAGVITQQPPRFPANGNILQPDMPDKKNTTDTSIIAHTPLFGTVEQPTKNAPPTAPVVAEPEPVVATPPLEIILLGTVVAGEHSVAVLRTASNREERIVRLHREIASGVVLEQVFQDAIEVRDHGRLRRIELRKGKQSDPREVPTPAAASASPPPVAGMVQRQISRNTIDRARRNLPQLLTKARVVPHFDQGKADGFVISNIVPRSLFQQIGLRNGDIIRKVNQEAITDAAQAMKLYQSLQNASDIQLEVERAGQVQTINYHIR